MVAASYLPRRKRKLSIISGRSFREPFLEKLGNGRTREGGREFYSSESTALMLYLNSISRTKFFEYSDHFNLLAVSDVEFISRNKSPGQGLHAILLSALKAQRVYVHAYTHREIESREQSRLRRDSRGGGVDTIRQVYCRS